MSKAPHDLTFEEERQLTCQAQVYAPLRTIVDEANVSGWDTFETIAAMEKVLRHLRIEYADPNPVENAD